MGFEHWLSHDNFRNGSCFSLNGGSQRFYGESSEILVDEAIKYKEKKRSQSSLSLVIWLIPS